jgi:hypothetical protein
VNVTAAPAVTVWEVGCVVIAGAVVAALTVSVAAVLVAEPALFVATQSYDPASAVVTALSVSVADVLPARAAPPFRHWNVGVGVPEAATVSVTEAPAVTVCEAGCVVKAGAVAGGPAMLIVTL